MIGPNRKPASLLQISDIKRYPVWEYASNIDPQQGEDESIVVPVTRLPLVSLDNRLIGLCVRFASGQLCWAIVGNIDVNSTRATETFLTLSLARELNGQEEWFFVAREFDIDYSERGPDALARFLGLSIDDIFPISYDVGQYVSVPSSAVKGQVLKEPRERLSSDDLMKLIFQKHEPES